jgi:hypothetical protein
VFEGGDDHRGDAGVDVLLGRFIVLSVVVDGAGFHAGPPFPKLTFALSPEGRHLIEQQSARQDNR